MRRLDAILGIVPHLWVSMLKTSPDWLKDIKSEPDCCPPRTWRFGPQPLSPRYNAGWTLPQPFAIRHSDIKSFYSVQVFLVAILVVVAPKYIYGTVNNDSRAAAALLLRWRQTFPFSCFSFQIQNMQSTCRFPCFSTLPPIRTPFRHLKQRCHRIQDTRKIWELGPLLCANMKLFCRRQRCTLLHVEPSNHDHETLVNVCCCYRGMHSGDRHGASEVNEWPNCRRREDSCHQHYFCCLKSWNFLLPTMFFLMLCEQYIARKNEVKTRFNEQSRMVSNKSLKKTSWWVNLHINITYYVTS